MTQNSNRKRTRNNAKPMVVSILDKDTAPGAVRLDSTFRALAQSEGDILVSAQLALSFDPSTTPTSASYTFATIATSDEFQSFAQQYQKFRIGGIRFDIYDLSPSNTADAYFGTFHSGARSTPYIPTLQNVIDAPDSTIIPPGTGKVSLYWLPSGVDEFEFAPISAFVDHGGLGAFIGGVTTPFVKYRIVIKAAVHFRGRI